MIENFNEDRNDTALKLKTSSVDGYHEGKLFCTFCNKGFAVVTTFLNHIKKHDPPGGFHCRYCKASFCTQGALKQHCLNQHMTIVCRLCKESGTAVTFNDETEYRNHIRTKHNGLDRVLFKCEKCGAAYKTVEPYRRHIDTACGTIKPYKCDQCFMTFMTKYNLKHHQDSHSGERKYCCSYCGKNFTQKGRLMEHERSHTGEKPYKCDVCGKCFAHRESIVTHSTIHTGIRLVECKCCHSRFSCHSNLIKHRRARPETCGQSQYDPPKNRIRKYPSRIPATLNPTSEIKVISSNKILKSVDLKRSEVMCLKKRNKTTARNDEKKDDSTDKKEEKILTKENVDMSISIYKNECNITNNGLSSEFTDINKNDYYEKATDNLLNSIDDENSKLYCESQNKNIDVENNNELQISTPMQLQVMNNLNSTTIMNNGIVDDVLIKTEHNANDKIIQYITFVDNNCNYNNLNEDDSNCLDKRQKCVDKSLNESGDKNASDNDILHETEVVLIKDNMSDINLTVEEDVLHIKLLSDEKVCLLETESSTQEIVSINNNEKIEDQSLEGTNINNYETNEKLIYDIMNKSNQDINTNCSENSKQSGNYMNLNKFMGKELKKSYLTSERKDISWNCPFCVKIYYKRKSFEKHLNEVHHQNNENISSIIDSNFIKDSTDNTPKTTVLIVSSSKESNFQCPICDKIYLLEKRLKNHIEKHGVEVELIQKCTAIDNSYYNRQKDKDHINQYTLKPLNKEISETRTQKIQIFQKKTNFVCDKCGKKFIGRTQLSDHVRSDCGRLPVYQCQECGKCLTTAGILKTHMLLHRKECPFQCNKCNKVFKVKAQYRAHVKYRHTEEKRFKCHLCPKEYPYRESLLTHMTVHTGMKRFLCNGCGKRFTCVSNLQAHRKVQADTCGLLPLNAKATEYLGVQKGNLLMGSKPVAGLDYIETNTVVAKDVINFASD